MTKVIYKKSFEKQLTKCPWFIREKALVWVKSVEENGLQSVRKCPGYHDEPLRGKRKGQRSVRLNKSYRLIYFEIKKEIFIKLLEVHKHEY